MINSVDDIQSVRFEHWNVYINHRLYRKSDIDNELSSVRDILFDAFTTGEWEYEEYYYVINHYNMDVDVGITFNRADGGIVLNTRWATRLLQFQDEARESFELNECTYNIKTYWNGLVDVAYYQPAVHDMSDIPY